MILLNNGVVMPEMVASTNGMNYSLLKDVMFAGVDNGYKAFDTARNYNNEHIVGDVISDIVNKKGIKRESLFITTKLENENQIKGDIENQIDISLKNLKTDYIDLWLMHWPFPEYFVRTWKKMEEIYKTGKVKAIGISNFRERHLKELLANGVNVMPSVCQIELHPLRTSSEMVEMCRSNNIAVQAYSPLCRMIPALTKNKTLCDLEKKYDKSIAQIILKWHLQKGFCPVFKSSSPKRIKQNIDINDFTLESYEIENIDLLDCDYKYHVESACCPGF